MLEAGDTWTRESWAGFWEQRLTAQNWALCLHRKHCGDPAADTRGVPAWMQPGEKPETEMVGIQVPPPSGGGWKGLQKQLEGITVVFLAIQ